MIRSMLVVASACLFSTVVRADCELLSAADAEQVLGPNVTDLSGDDSQLQCMFLGGEPQGTFIVQFNPREYYHQATILEPHTPADVGEEGRSNVDTNGITALQFVQGDQSVTMSVRPVSCSDRDYLDALIRVGSRLAERLE